VPLNDVCLQPQVHRGNLGLKHLSAQEILYQVQTQRERMSSYTRTHCCNLIWNPYASVKLCQALVLLEEPFFQLETHFHLCKEFSSSSHLEKVPGKRTLDNIPIRTGAQWEIPCSTQLSSKPPL